MRRGDSNNMKIMQNAECRMLNAEQGSGFAVAGSRFGVHGSGMSGQWAVARVARETHHSSFIIHHSAFPRAVTLVEMLIVISIIVIVTVAAIKVVQPDNQRRVREAARAVNVYLSSAQHRAMEIGRPCGVIFHRANGTNFPTAATVLDQCEVPPPYAGDATDAVVRVQQVSATAQPTLRIQIRSNDFSNNLIRPGDQIQLNGQGPSYVIAAPDPSRTPPDFKLDANGFFDFTGTASTPPWIDSNYLTAIWDSTAMPIQASPWAAGAWSGPVAFAILRQPVKSAAAALRLPEGAVVDLDFSGTDYQSFQDVQSTLNPPGPFIDVAVMFSGNGAVEGYYWNNAPHAATGPIYMLVGSRSRVRDYRIAAQQLPATPNANDWPNWADLSSEWISINYQTGLVSTDENYAINFATEKDKEATPRLIDWTKAPPNASTNWLYFLNLSRWYAQQSQHMGGR